MHKERELDFLTKALLSRIKIPKTFKTDRDQSPDFERFATGADEIIIRANNLGVDIGLIAIAANFMLDCEEERQNKGNSASN